MVNSFWTEQNYTVLTNSEIVSSHVVFNVTLMCFFFVFVMQCINMRVVMQVSWQFKLLLICTGAKVPTLADWSTLMSPPPTSSSPLVYFYPENLLPTYPPHPLTHCYLVTVTSTTCAGYSKWFPPQVTDQVIQNLPLLPGISSRPVSIFQPIVFTEYCYW